MDYKEKVIALLDSKELSQEQKEKLESIFPELKESEDERIKKWIIKQIKTYDPSNIREEALAWLEKQGEQNQKHFELKAGHWYICHRAFCCRADHLTVKEGERFMCEKDGIVKGFVIKEPEKYFKEVCAPAPIEDERKPANKVEPKFKIGQIIKKEGFNLGFTIVKIEDGFYYNDEGDYFPFTDQDNWELVEQSPAWSEEEIEKAAQEWDSKANFNPFYMTMDGDKPTGVKQDVTTHAESFKAGVNWILKSLRPQNTWRPSDEQMRALSDINLTGGISYAGQGQELINLYNDLKKLK